MAQFRTPTPPTEDPNGDPLRTPRLRRQMALARLSVAWERLWPRLWPALAVVVLYAAAALLGIIESLPAWLHVVVLAASVAATATLAVRHLRGFRWPDSLAARRQLEQASGLTHRPLTGLDDALAAGANDPAAASLWQAHQRRLRRVLGKIRVGWPSASLAPRDPRALRAIPVLLLAAGLIASGSAAPDRLLRALVPDLAAGAAPPPEVTVWLDPPSYTGQAPRVLETGSPDAGAADTAAAQSQAEGEAAQAEDGASNKDTPAQPRVVRVPEGSRVLVQVQGGAGPARLAVGEESVALDQVAPQAWKTEVTLGGDGLTVPGADHLIVQQDGVELARWPLHLLIDQKPTVAFRNQPREARRHALRVAHTADDDHGVTALRLKAERPSDSRIDPIVRTLPLGQPDEKTGTLRDVTYHDLTAHIWAGLKVQMTLEAEDARGQVGSSETLTVTLPEREFNHPVAKKLVDLRKQLARAPDDRQPVIDDLQRLQTRPDRFFGDVVVALGLRTSERRLAYNQSFQAVRDVQELMWRLALRLEDGELAIAERDLRRIQQELQEALADPNTTDAEIQRLMDQLEQAMSRFLEAMRQRMQQQLSEGQQPRPMPEGARQLETRDLQEMMDRMRDMAESGARDAARQMLSELQNMLENMRMAPQMGQMSEQSRQAQEMMRQLQNLTQEQQNLLDETFRQAQPGGRQPRQGQQGQMQGQMPGQMPQWDGETRRPGQQGQQGQRGQGQRQGQQGQGPAEQQEAIRRQLGELMREFGNMMGNIPGELGEAEQQMRNSSRALGDGNPRGAVPPQQNALENLRNGMQAMRQQMQQQMQGQQRGRGQGQGRFGFQPPRDRDPLGRSQGDDGQGALDRGDVEIPSEGQLQRAREILDELRRRAGERDRPELEQEYIRRLLERF